MTVPTRRHMPESKCSTNHYIMRMQGEFNRLTILKNFI